MNAHSKDKQKGKGFLKNFIRLKSLSACEFRKLGQ